MATITLPVGVFKSDAKQADGTTAVPLVNPTDPTLPRYQPPVSNLPVNPENFYIPEPVGTSVGDRSAYGGPVFPTGKTREANPSAGQSAQRTARLAGAAFPKDV